MSDSEGLFRGLVPMAIVINRGPDIVALYIARHYVDVVDLKIVMYDFGVKVPVVVSKHSRRACCRWRLLR